MAAGIQPWIELPVWVPPEGEDASVHDSDVSAVYAAGLTCRPVTETIADTWRWLQEEGYPQPRPGLPEHGLSPDVEQRVLAGLTGS
jgi:2'-hydroxyisoflavone reductase